MSFDVFLQRCRDGQPATFPRAIFEERFGPYVAERGRHFARVQYPDRACADIYLGDEENIRGMMFNRFGGDAFFDGLYRITDRVKGVVLWPDAAPNCAVTDVAALEHLPEDLLRTCGPALVVREGKAMKDAVSGV